MIRTFTMMASRFIPSQPRMSKITNPAVATQYPSATPLTMGGSGCDQRHGRIVAFKAMRADLSSSLKVPSEIPELAYPKNLDRGFLLRPSLSTSRLSITISSYKGRMAPTCSSYSRLLASAPCQSDSPGRAAKIYLNIGIMNPRKRPYND
jgi:hypothetical protein